MKKLYILLFAVVLALSLAACGSSDNSGGNAGGNTGGNAGGDAGGESGQQLVIATGGTSGTYYPLGGGIAQIITDNTDNSASAQVTGASVENMRLIADQEVDIAFTQTDIASYANTGTEMFAEGKVANLTGIATLYNETIQVVAPADSAINSVADLKGKRVSVGAPGSGTELNAKQILEVYGLTFDDLQAEYLSFGDSVQKIQDGNMDAAFVTAGAPTSAVTELSATKGVKIIPLDQEYIDQLKQKYPFYVEETIPADTYSGVGEVKTVAVKAMLVARKELSEDTVYQVTKAFFENIDKLVAINTKAKSITLETALDGMGLDIHPGALKFFEEKGLK